MNSDKRYILTPEQFSFMQAHHNEIEQAMAPPFADDKASFWLDTFIDSEEYKKHFGDMDWDDVYDRYTETPGYDNTLKSALRKKIREAKENKEDGHVD